MIATLFPENFQFQNLTRNGDHPDTHATRTKWPEEIVSSVSFVSGPWLVRVTEDERSDEGDGPRPGGGGRALYRVCVVSASTDGSPFTVVKSASSFLKSVDVTL